MKKIHYLALIGSALSFAWAGAKIDNTKLSLESMMNINVSVASLKAEKVSDAPGIISVYTADDIKRWNWQSLEEALMQTPGFYSRQSIALGTHGTMGARGDHPYFGNRILFLVDGRPFRSSLYGASYSDLLYNFPMQVVERIEIIRGPGSVLYGSSAYDGVVSVVTRKNDKEGLQGKLNLSGLNSSYKGDAWGIKDHDKGYSGFGDLGYGTSDYYFRAVASKKYEEGQTVRFKDESGIEQDQYSSHKNSWDGWSAMVDMGYKNFSNQTIIAQAKNPVASASFLAPLYDQDRTRLFNNTGFFQDFGDKFRIQTNFTINHEANEALTTLNKHYVLGAVLEENAPDLIPLLLQSQIVSEADLYKDYGALTENHKGANGSLLSEITFLFSPTNKINLVLGSSIERLYGHDRTGPTTSPYPNDSNIVNLNSKVDAVLQMLGMYQSPTPSFVGIPSGTYLTNTPKYNENVYSTYFQGDFRPWDPLKVFAGGQFNKPAKGDLDFVPRAGFVWNISDEFGLKSEWAQAFRNPTPYEKYTTAYGDLIANPDNLKPEKVTTIDAEVYYNLTEVNFSASFWMNENDNAINPHRRDYNNGMLQFMNDASDKSYGYDLAMRVLPIDGLVLESVISTFTNLRSGDDKYQPQNVFHQRVAYKPIDDLEFIAQYSHYGVSEYGSRHQDIEAVIPEANPYEDSQVLDLGTAWNLSETFRWHKINTVLNLGVKNVFNDTRYVQSGSQAVDWPMWPGRQFTLGITSSF